MSEYSKRFCTAEGGEFYEWLITLSAKDKKKVFQMPKEEILSTINVTFKFKPAYQVVLCAVIEQVANYFETGYTEDGGTDAEVSSTKLLCEIVFRFLIINNSISR